MTRRARRIILWSIGAVAVVVLLAVGSIIADQAVRGVMEREIGQTVTEQLPEGVSVEPVVTVGGGSAITQYLAGSLDAVTVEADPFTVDGVPLRAHIEAQGLPLDPGQPVQEIDGTLVIGQAALNGWTAGAGVPGAVQLGEGTIGYDGVVSVFGVEFGYHVDAVPVVDGPWIDLQPKTATVTSGPLQLDVKQLLGALADQNVRICAAQYLPAPIMLSGIQVQPGEVTVRLGATDLVLDQLDAGSTGTCP